jgi:hypothetical protein
MVDMDVAEWQRTLGLEQYAPVYRQNEIDHEVLPELTEADLEKLGVPMGHRKRLIRAIATLRTAAPPAPPPAERRQMENERGAAAADGDVLRSGRLDGAVVPA